MSGYEICRHLRNQGNLLPVLLLTARDSIDDRVLGLDSGDSPIRKDIQKAFRVLLRDAHPDHGGASIDAAGRIADLREARRILLTGSPAS